MNARLCLLECCRVLERKPDTNAFVRTTTAVTMFNAGIKVQIHIFTSKKSKAPYKPQDLKQACITQKLLSAVQVNVIPSLAEAYVNLRIHSAHSLQEVHPLL